VEGDKYLFKNKEITVDIVALLDSAKEMIQKKIKCNLDTVTNSHPSYCEEEETPEIHYSRALEIFSEASSDLLRNTSHRLLAESTATSYARMGKTMLQYLKLESKALPSYYLIIKSRPPVLYMEIVPDLNY